MLQYKELWENKGEQGKVVTQMEKLLFCYQNTDEGIFSRSDVVERFSKSECTKN